MYSMTGFTKKKKPSPRLCRKTHDGIRWRVGPSFPRRQMQNMSRVLLIHKSAKYVVRVSEPQITASVKLRNMVRYLAVNEWKAAKVYWRY